MRFPENPKKPYCFIWISWDLHVLCTLRNRISELRWTLEECYGANQLRIIQFERYNKLEGAETLPEEMK